VEIGSNSNFYLILPISNYDVVVSYVAENREKFYLSKIELTLSVKIHWTMATIDLFRDAFTTSKSMAIIDSTETKIYVVNSFISSIYFYTLSKDTGETIGTQYRSEGFGGSPDILSLAEVDQTIYIFYENVNKYITVFDIKSKEFISDYHITDKVVSVNFLSITFSNYVYLFGKRTRPHKFYASRTYKTAVASLPYIELNEVMRMQPSKSNLELHRSKNLTFLYSTNIIQDGLSPNFYSTPNFSSNKTYYSSVWNDDHYEFNLLRNTEYVLNFTWTCQHRQSQEKVKYNLETMMGDIGNWVSLDVVNNVLRLNKTPFVKSPSTYFFVLNSTWGKESMRKDFHITISP
jgi:hypothetical protein